MKNASEVKKANSTADAADDYERRTISKKRRALTAGIPACVGILLIGNGMFQYAKTGDNAYFLPLGAGLILCLISIAIFRTKTEQVLTAAADQRNRDADAIHTPETGKERVQRYALAVGLLFGAAYFGLWSTDKDASLLTLIFLGFAALAAHEVGKWLLIIGGVGAVALGAINLLGIVATSPIAIAIIVGAFIIAAAVSK